MRRYAVVLLVALGCGDRTDDQIGNPCVDDRDCVDVCYEDSNRFPAGFCSRACGSDFDCPADTACIETSGGVCLFVCPEFDCGYLGPGWHCSDRDRRGTGGRIPVCIGD